MTDIAIFSFEAPTKISPDAFAALSDADKSLFARLVQERAASKQVISQATGLPFTHVSALARQVHSVRLAGEERAPIARSNHGYGDTPHDVMRLLRVFAEADGPLTITYAEMEARASLVEGTAHTSLCGLKIRGLVTCLRAGRGGRTATWSITDEGREFALVLFPEVSHA